MNINPQTQQIKEVPQNNIFNTTKFASSLVNSINQGISQNIQSSRLQVSEQQKQLVIEKQPKIKDGDSVDQKKIAEIVKKRKQLDMEVKRLQYQEKIEKQKSRKISPLGSRKTRSTFSKEDFKKLHQIKKSTEIFEQKVKTINLQLEEKIKLIKQQQLQRRQKQEQNMHQEKQKKLQKSLQKIKQRKISREKEIQQLNKLFNKVKNQKFLHQKIQEKWKNHQEQMQKQRKIILEKEKQQKKFSFQEIMEHEKKYRNSFKEQSKQRNVKTSRIKVQISRITQEYMTHHKPSKFFETVSQQQKVQRQKQQDKIFQYREFIKKRLSYAQTIKQINRKNLKQSIVSKKQSQNHQPKKVRTKSMSSIDIYKKGNQYMKQIHSQIKNLQQNEKQLSSQLNQTTASQLNERIKYRNYLHEEQHKRMSTLSLNTIKEKTVNKNSQNQDLKELKRIIQQKNENKADKLYKAKMLAKKLDQKSIGNTNAMISSIAAKLEIINEFA